MSKPLSGVTTNGSRVLVAGQSDTSENGIYVTASGAWTRAADADASSDFQFGKAVPVDSAGYPDWHLLLQWF